jgi:hypothetical protein
MLKNSWTSLLAKKKKKKKRKEKKRKRKKKNQMVQGKKAIILKALGAWWLVRADHGR